MKWFRHTTKFPGRPVGAVALLIGIAIVSGCQKQPPAVNAAGAVPVGKTTGWEIKYTATVALARRGSDLIKDRFDILKDMLDEDLQRNNCRVSGKEGAGVVNEQAATNNVTSALKAIAELHRRRPEMDLTPLTPAVDKLIQSENPVVRTEAERTRLALGKS
jgi:hypothetical protein